MVWSLWWVWIIGAVVLAVLEVLAPTQIFLGFAIGAAGVGLGLLAGIPGLAGSLPALGITFAVLSLIAWLVLRPLMGVRKGQVKHFEHDINED
ncbi:MAG: hypothetical protein OIF48_02580 [Silicimonas sp.]|nr:hypothetical protein [Silicimonas sp.]